RHHVRPGRRVARRDHDCRRQSGAEQLPRLQDADPFGSAIGAGPVHPLRCAHRRPGRAGGAAGSRRCHQCDLRGNRGAGPQLAHQERIAPARVVRWGMVALLLLTLLQATPPASKPPTTPAQPPAAPAAPATQAPRPRPAASSTTTALLYITDGSGRMIENVTVTATGPVDREVQSPASGPTRVEGLRA